MHAKTLPLTAPVAATLSVERPASASSELYAPSYVPTAQAGRGRVTNLTLYFAELPASVFRVNVVAVATYLPFLSFLLATVEVPFISPPAYLSPFGRPFTLTVGFVSALNAIGIENATPW